MKEYTATLHVKFSAQDDDKAVNIVRLLCKVLKNERTIYNELIVGEDYTAHADDVVIERLTTTVTVSVPMED